MEKRTFPVVGMACSACSANVERRLNELEGIQSASVSLASRTALVEWDPERINPEQIKAAINAIGYDLIIGQDRSVEAIERREYTLLRRQTLLAWLLSIACMVCSMAWKEYQLALICALLTLWFCGRRFYTSALRQLRHGMANMDTLVTLSTLVSFLFGAYATFIPQAHLHPTFDSTVMIIAFVLTGRLIEERAHKNTASAIRQLMGLQPRQARLVTGDTITSVPLSTISVGDVLEVRAGERIAVDGLVTSAESFMTADGAYVDESMLTGEPVPALKQKSDRVMAGTTVQQGSLRYRARQVGEQTALAQIIRTVEQAQNSKPPVQRLVDRMAMVFVPVVIGLSLLTFLTWWAVEGNSGLPHAIITAVTVLVVACPCAMGLAMPMALMVGIGRAARQGILVKDATAIELLRKVQVLVTDKTGTLTIPNPQIDFTRADELPFEQRETLKPHAHEAIEDLHRRHIDVIMMSGDREEAVAHWAQAAGIRQWKSLTKPTDKEEQVKALQEQGRIVAMIGDGINDSQALARADVSIAIGQGTDVAMDVAQVTLMSTDLRALPEAVRLSDRIVRTIRQNLFWAFVYNIVCIPLAAGLPRAFGIDFQMTPMLASALMALSSVSVVLNSLRLKS